MPRLDPGNHRWTVPRSDAPTFTPDGRFLIFAVPEAGSVRHLWYRPLAGDTTPKQLTSSAYEIGASVSPDGRWMAYVSTMSGAEEVYVQAFPGGGARYPVSAGGGNEPLWSARDGRIYYRRGRLLIAATVKTSAEFRVVSRDSVFAFPPTFVAFSTRNTAPGRGWDLARDGRVVIQAVGDTTSALRVITNWLPELRARLSRQR